MILHRLFGSTSVSLLLIGLFFLWMPAMSEETALSQASYHYEEGLQAFHGDEINVAKIHIKNALREDPTLISAHILLAKIYLQESEGGLAEKELLIAERLGASRLVTIIPLAEAYLHQKRYTDLIENLYPTFKSAEVDSQLMVMRGNAHLELNQLEDARRAFEQAREYQSANVDSVIGTAQVYIREGRFAEAEAESIVAIMLDRENPDAWRLKGAVNHAQNRLTEALSDYEKAAGLDSRNLTAQMARMGILIDLGRYQQAAELAQKIRPEHPYDPRLPYLESIALEYMGSKGAALEASKDADVVLTKLPEKVMQTHGPSIMLAALVRFGMNQPEQAFIYLERYLSINPNHLGARKLLAVILLDRGDFDRVVTLLEPALKKGLDDYLVYSLLGEAYSRIGKFSRAQDLLDKAISINPDSAESRARRAMNNLERGSDVAAYADLESVFKQDPLVKQTGMFLVVFHLRHNNHQAALETAHRLVEVSPRNLTYLNLLAVTQTSAGQLQAARDNFDRILAMSPDFLPAQINYGKLALMEGKPLEAERHFSALLQRNPKSSLLMTEMARALQAQNQIQEAIRWLEKAIDTDRKSLTAYTTLASLLIRTGDLKRAQKIVADAQLIAPSDLRILEAGGRVELALGHKVKAKATFRRMSADVGFSARELLRIAQFQLAADDIKGAVWSLQKAVEGKPDSLQARTLLVDYLLKDRQLGKAMAQAEQIRNQYPDKAIGYSILGEIAVRQKKYGEALAYYKKANSMQLHSLHLLGMVDVYLALGQEQKAIKELNDWSSRHPEDVLVRQMAAEIYMRNAEWKKARIEYEAILEAQSASLSVLNNLAVLYDMEDDPKALEFARKARSLAPKSASVNDTLGWILVRNGRAAEGLNYLRNASALSLANPEIHYHLGVALHQLGRSSEAKKELENALKSNQANTWTPDAQSLLRRLSQVSVVE